MVKDYPLQDIAINVLSTLQDIYNNNINIFKNTTQILIELQPKCNPKMLFTSHILYGKLVELYLNSSTTIKFVRASKKLNAYTGPEITCLLKGAYAKRKWLSIQYVKWFLENKFSKEQCDKWLPLLLSQRADNADTALMAINAIHGIPKKKV